MHGHREMEIVSYVVRGEMEHKDSLGNGSVIKHGEVQRMSAGTGIQHGEWNASQDHPLHLVQIWLLPSVNGSAPSYEQAAIDMDAMREGWVVLAAEAGGVVTVQSSAVIAGTIAASGTKRALEFDPGRAGYLFLVRGSIRFHGNELVAGDAAMIEDEAALEFDAIMESEVLAFDLA
jgi:redox-sensitive bicupin YhaK (pirin superfamily)